MGYKLSSRSAGRLHKPETHPDIIKVVERAIELTEVDFGISQTVRTIEQQEENVRKGVSKTMKSRHIPSSNASGMCEAVDVYAWVDGGVSWDAEYYHQIADAFKEAANELDIEITWGGDWKSFFDGPHFQLG